MKFNNVSFLIEMFSPFILDIVMDVDLYMNLSTILILKSCFIYYYSKML